MKKSIIETTSLKARANHYNDKDTLRFKSSVKKASNSDLPFLNKKQLWLVSYLSKNDINKNYIYTLDGLSNEYRKTIKDSKEKKAKKSDYIFRKSFNLNEKISDSDFQSARTYIYISTKRLFEMDRNSKGNYIIIEKPFVENLVLLKDRK